MTEALALLALAAVAVVIVAVGVVRSGIHHTREQRRQANLDYWACVSRSLNTAAVTLLELPVVFSASIRHMASVEDAYARLRAAQEVNRSEAERHYESMMARFRMGGISINETSVIFDEVPTSDDTPLYDQLQARTQQPGISITDAYERETHRITRSLDAHVLDRLSILPLVTVNQPQRPVILRRNDGA